ncbi:MAG: hypothetical protein HY562_11010 [Ignavibacteriales bacterium]|nr:hypothetical protein [Ignavibacteriales bacterium]
MKPVKLRHHRFFHKDQSYAMRAKPFLIIGLLLIIAGSTLSQDHATVASVYYWRAKPDKIDEYNRYIQSVAEPIDEQARKNGAFISVTTFLAERDSSAWTHMRVFFLRDSIQLINLTRLLDEASVFLEPDEAKRKKRSAYAATLRDFVGHEILRILY